MPQNKPPPTRFPNQTHKPFWCVHIVRMKTAAAAAEANVHVNIGWHPREAFQYMRARMQWWTYVYTYIYSIMYQLYTSRRRRTHLMCMVCAHTGAITVQILLGKLYAPRTYEKLGIYGNSNMHQPHTHTRTKKIMISI